MLLDRADGTGVGFSAFRWARYNAAGMFTSVILVGTIMKANSLLNESMVSNIHYCYPLAVARSFSSAFQSLSLL